MAERGRTPRSRSCRSARRLWGIAQEVWVIDGSDRLFCKAEWPLRAPPTHCRFAEYCPMTDSANYPLAGIRVIDMSRVLAGPFAGRMLCDLGADVVKVEPPEGDVTRNWGAQIHGQAGYFNQQNVGKRGMCVDLGVAGGAALI